MRELVTRPSKWEMVKAIDEWVRERCGIDYAVVRNLERLNEDELMLFLLAFGYKLDQRVQANLQNRYRWEWERVYGKRADIVVPPPALPSPEADIVVPPSAPEDE